jgi:hypothetical protein
MPMQLPNGSGNTAQTTDSSTNGQQQNKRFIVLPLSAAAEGIRVPMALKTLAAGLYPDKVK